MNLPNKISLARICLIPAVVALYLCNIKIAAAAVFVFAASTDFIDGIIARKYNLVTDLGKILDTTADKLLVTSALLLVITDPIGSALPVAWGVSAALLILAREFIIMALRTIAAKKGVIIAADKWGKYKAFLTDIALVAFMILATGYFSGTFLFVFRICCYVLLGISCILTLISCINYLIKNKEVLK